MAMKSKICQLCNGEAFLYCSSDSAFLCWNCDATVHHANFLVARHIRLTLCSTCNHFTANRFSGVISRPFQSLCPNCSPESVTLSAFSSLSSSSSSCSSTAESFVGHDRRQMKRPDSGDKSKKKKRNKDGLKWKAEEGVMVNWCRKLGLNGDSKIIIPMATHAFGACLSKMTVSPLRVSLAGSFWFSVKLCEERSSSTWKKLKGLEKISGVSGKLIIAAESKVARVVRVTKPQLDRKEGWAECSV